MEEKKEWMAENSADELCPLAEEIPSAEEVRALFSGREIGKLREMLLRIPAADAALIFEELEEEERPRVFRILPKTAAADVFSELSFTVQKELIDRFSDSELRTVLDEMAMDDTVDMIEEMPASVARRILAHSTGENRAQINQLLQYPKDSAGSLLTTEYVGFRRNTTVKEAFALLREVAIEKETVYTCYVIDGERHLLGTVSVKKLLISDPEETVGEIMDENPLFVTTHGEVKEVCAIFDKYRLLALPVVDGECRLLGIITVDDAVDAMQEDAEDAIAVMAAVTPGERTYLETSVFGLWKSRVPWLLLLMLTATFTGIIISHFENALAACAVLTAFIPMLMGTGGNAGSQASVTVIRGISTGEIAFRDFFRVIWKEARVAVLCSVVLGAATFGKILLVDGLWMGNVALTPSGILVAFTVAAALCVTVICAKLIGGALPLLAHKIGLDPAVMASPFITTAVDAVSLLVYFGVAGALLGI